MWSAYNHVSVILVQRHSINAEFRVVPYSKCTVSINHVYHSKSSLHSLPCIPPFALHCHQELFNLLLNRLSLLAEKKS